MSLSQNITAGSNARNPDAAITGLQQASATIIPWPPRYSDDIAESSDEFENPFKIRVVNDSSCRSRASSLIQRRYAWRGYSTSPLKLDSSGRITLSACVEDTIVGTVTASLDSSAGMFVERLYPGEVQAFRDEGRKLCEFTKLAVDESVRSNMVLARMFHVAFSYVFDLHQCTDLLIEVNPRHARFYQRMLGFQRAAVDRFDSEVNAPSVLLRLDLDHCATESARLGGSHTVGQAERSFYPYVFAPKEAAEIVGRLGTFMSHGSSRFRRTNQ